MYHMSSLPIPKIHPHSSDVIITKSDISLFFITVSFSTTTYVSSFL